MGRLGTLDIDWTPRAGFSSRIPRNSGRAHDDGLRTPEQQFQALLFHRRMEAADDRQFVVPEVPRQVEGPDDHVPRAPARTEEAEQLPIEDGPIANAPKARPPGH